MIKAARGGSTPGLPFAALSPAQAAARRAEQRTLVEGAGGSVQPSGVRSHASGGIYSIPTTPMRRLLRRWSGPFPAVMPPFYRSGQP